LKKEKVRCYEVNVKGNNIRKDEEMTKIYKTSDVISVLPGCVGFTIATAWIFHSLVVALLVGFLSVALALHLFGRENTIRRE
jgi:hypothetical protein